MCRGFLRTLDPQEIGADRDKNRSIQVKTKGFLLLNIIAVIILAAIVFDVIINIVSDVLNLRMLQAHVPEPFQGVYDADKYRKSQDYLRVNSRFGWVSAVVNLMAVLLFWFQGGFPAMDNWVRSFGNGPVLTGLMYMGSLMILYALLSQPFSIYATFVIEERFGFNKTTWKTYSLDLLKGLVLAILLGTPLLAGILAFFEYAGSHAWIYCWTVVTLYMLVVQYIAPTWIMPIFNKFKPIEDGQLKSAILSYARSIQFPLKNVYVMDGSKRSSKSNAFFTGFGKNKRIVLFDTLINQHTVPELVAVLAHEMGHYKKKHILQGMLLGILQTGIMFYLLSFVISYQGLFDAFYMNHGSVYAGLIFFGMLFAPLDFFVGILMQIRSRSNEYQADRFSVETTRNPGAMIDALKKLSVQNLSNLLPHPFYVFLNYSHPPVLKRIEAIDAFKSTE
ncbi:MAG: M48 family metallopeptidase [Desulfobacterales bacterium]|nr:M48 family metallopeptidase [Desulfobacterales bacterium]MDX2511694.1 M48 family metallopeptidase [Desulfobacterales bacterium]